MSDRKELSHLSDLLRNALPLTLNLSLATLCSLIFFKFIGSYHPDNHYLMSLYFPFAGITIAIIESLKIPFYVHVRSWADPEKLTGQIVSAILFGLSLLFFFSILFFIFKERIFTGLSIPSSYQSRFSGYVFWMLLSSAPALVLNVFTAVLFVRISARVSFLFNLVAMTIANLAALGLYFKTKDLNSVGIAIFACMSVGSVLTFFFLLWKKFVWVEPIEALPRAFSHYAREYLKYSLPYTLTFVVYGLYAYTLNTIVTGYGLKLTAVFGIFSRIQNILIIPAVALGTYTAVKLMSLENRTSSDEAFLVRVGLKGSVLVYAFLSTLAFLFRNEIATVFTKDQALIDLFSSKFPWILAITFLLGPIIFIISFLEQSGRAIKTLALNLTFLSGELCILLLINALFFNINYVLASIAYIKVASLLYFACRRNFGVLT